LLVLACLGFWSSAAAAAVAWALSAQNGRPANPRPQQDVAAVRDAMLNAVGTAWGGLKEATVEVFEHQYGDQAAATVQDACEVVDGIANMG